MRIFHSLSVLIVLAGLAGCAQIGSPTGGEKDITPPQILESKPQNFSTNFAEDKIVLEFDEFVKLDNQSQQLVLSPPMETDPEFKLKGKKLELIFQEELLQNTTYSINFGTGIKDITENNPLDSNNFVFSTGDYLDSLFVTGSVKNAFDLEPSEGLLVMLYENLEDTIPKKKRPLYVAKTRKNGTFALRNLKAGTFRMLVLKDGNNNFLFDLPTEAIAFPDSFVVTGKDDSLRLYLFEEPVQRQYVSSLKMAQYGLLEAIFNKPAVDAKIRPLSPVPEGEWYLEEKMTVGDTIRYWLEDMGDMDTLLLEVQEGDSILDTIRVRLPEKVTDRSPKKGKKKVTLPKLKVDRKSANGKQHFYLPLTLSSNYPIRQLNLTDWLLVEDSIDIPLDSSLVSFDFHNITIDYPWKKGVNYKVQIPTNGIRDFFTIGHDTLDYQFRTLDDLDYGKLEINMLPADEELPLVLQTFQGENLVREDTLKGKQKLVFPRMVPGKYRFKLILDRNGNGEWDTGDYFEQQQPERVLFHPEEVDIRANWDLSIDWEIIP